MYMHVFHIYPVAAAARSKKTINLNTYIVKNSNNAPEKNRKEKNSKSNLNEWDERELKQLNLNGIASFNIYIKIAQTQN